MREANNKPYEELCIFHVFPSLLFYFWFSFPQNLLPNVSLTTTSPDINTIVVSWPDLGVFPVDLPQGHWSDYPSCSKMLTTAIFDFTEMCRFYTTQFILSLVLIGKVIEVNYRECSHSERDGTDIDNVQFSQLPKLSICTQFVGTLRSAKMTNDPVCRQKLVLMYLCSILLAQSYAPEPNPGLCYLS